MNATNKRPKIAIVSQQSVEQAGMALAKLPEKPKENFSLREAVTQLEEQIKAALAKGYSYDDIASILNDRGIDISASTLKNYVPAGKRQATRERSTKTVKRSGQDSKPDSNSG